MQSQIKGMVVLALVFAIIPFIRFVYPTVPCPNPPVHSLAAENTVPVEIISERGIAGIYFLEKGSSLTHLLRETTHYENVPTLPDVHQAMALRLTDDTQAQHGVLIEQMESAKRLALGLPIDINRATMDELILVPGIGAVTAEKIVLLRKEKGGFVSLDELKEISGIKDKKLQKLKPYLMVD